MSELTQALNTPFEFKHGDKVYQVSHLTQKIKAAFEQKLFSRARDAAIALKSCMSPPEYQDHLRTLNDNFISGQYALESPIGQKMLNNIKGVVILAALLFDLSEDEMHSIIIANSQEVTSLMRLIISESFGITEEEVKA